MITLCHKSNCRLFKTMSTILLAVILFSANRADGLIDVNYTPIHLTKQSKLILWLEVGPPNKLGQMEVKIIKALKGKAPSEGMKFIVSGSASLAPLLEGDSSVFNVFDGVVDKTKVPAVAFLADPSGKERAAVIIQKQWYTLAPGDAAGEWKITVLPPDSKWDLLAVWEGRADMLGRCVEYIQSDPTADVPVVVGAAWDKKLNSGKIEGWAESINSADLTGDGKPVVFISCVSGDRVYAWDSKTSALKDVTATLKISSKSASVTFADFNGDGKIDIASCKGKEVTIFAQSASGTFESKLASITLNSAGVGIAAVDVGIKGRSGIVVNQNGLAVLIRPGTDGKFTSGPLAKISGKFPPEEMMLESLRTLQAADFDGDGYCDVIQMFDFGGFFYKGKGKGLFAPPVSAGAIWSDEKGAESHVGDFDGDGKLDIMLSCETRGLVMCNNLGGGKFKESCSTGEPLRITKKQSLSGMSVGDLNSDGRQDIILLRPGQGPHLYFNRGFATFGYSKEMELGFLEGQQAGLLADINGDGGKELVVVTADGQVRTIMLKPPKRRKLSLKVSLDPSIAGPVTVTGWNYDRCLGARNLQPASSQVAFDCRKPTLIIIKWQLPGGKIQEKEIDVERGIVHVVIGPGGAKKIKR